MLILESCAIQTELSAEGGPGSSGKSFLARGKLLLKTVPEEHADKSYLRMCPYALIAID